MLLLITPGLLPLQHVQSATKDQLALTHDQSHTHRHVKTNKCGRLRIIYCKADDLLCDFFFSLHFGVIVLVFSPHILDFFIYTVTVFNALCSPTTLLNNHNLQ